jgi:hypothetical protein
MRGMVRALGVLMAIVASAGSFAWADDKKKDEPPPPPAADRLMFSDLTVFRLNPLGLETRARFGIQKRLYYSEKAITTNNFRFFGVYPKLNPVSGHLALGGEIQPASIFNLKAFVEVQKYFGSLGYLQSFRTPTANFSDERLKDLRGSEQTSTIYHAGLAPLLQLKVGPVAVRSLWQFDYWRLNIRDNDTVAYEATFDTLLPDNGWTVSADNDVLFVGRPGLAIGLRHTWVKPIYGSEHFVDKNDKAIYDDDNSHHRIGLLVAYTLRDTPQTAFNKPTILLIASWYLTHRWRTGKPDIDEPDISGDTNSNDFRSRAFPYLLLGFAFESDIYPAHD